MQVSKRPCRLIGRAYCFVSYTLLLCAYINWLLTDGYIPSFCTACYRAGRTGDRFMSLAKTGEISNCCQPNALLTLREYLDDYASPETRQKGMEAIRRELDNIPNPKVRTTCETYLQKIDGGERDFRF